MDPPRYVNPLEGRLPSEGSLSPPEGRSPMQSTGGRYASYWNAYLLHKEINQIFLSYFRHIERDIFKQQVQKISQLNLLFSYFSCLCCTFDQRSMIFRYLTPQVTNIIKERPGILKGFSGINFHGSTIG